MTISLVGTDPEKTAATLHAIGEAILQEQRSQRADRLAKARVLLEAELVNARARMKLLKDAIGRLQAESGHARPLEAIDRRTQAAALRIEAGSALDQLIVLERRASDVAFTRRSRWRTSASSSGPSSTRAWWPSRLPSRPSTWPVAPSWSS